MSDDVWSEKEWQDWFSDPLWELLRDKEDKGDEE